MSNYSAYLAKPEIAICYGIAYSLEEDQKGVNGKAE